MLKSQAIQLKQSELRQKANATSDAEENERIRRELAEMEPAYRAAILSEATHIDGAFTDHPDDNESVETATAYRPSQGRRQSLGRPSMPLPTRRNVSGAVSELQSERGLPSHLLPLGYVLGIQSGHYGPIGFPCSCSSLPAICVPRPASQTSWALTYRG